MANRIPFIPSRAHYRMSLSFGDENVLMDVRWNARDSAWYFDLREMDESVIIIGVKLVLGVNFGRRSTHRLFQNNIFHAFDTSNEGREAAFDDLGTRVVVARYSLAELRGDDA